MRSIAKKCSVRGCSASLKTRLRRGLCDAHYVRVLKYGSPMAHKPTRVNHGQTKLSEYSTWASMIQRCYNPNEIAYSRYGARGIRVCERWRLSFQDFYADMGPKPTPAHTLDRIKSDRDYGPDNCRWATRPEQSVNRRLRSHNPHGFRGVTKPKGCVKWTSTLTFDGKSFHMTGIETREEAAWMYDQMALAIHGEFAQLNFTYMPIPASC